MDETRRPWWTVTGVFDPEGGGSDFAYTEGLARADKPELHMWRRPTVGDDPGDDWCFSHRDACRILNEAAWRLVEGELAVGDSWETSYDEGFVTVRFTVHEPVDADSVDAFGARGAPVLPLKWELVRPPLGAPRPLSSAEERRAAEEYDDVLRGLGGVPVVPDGWELPADPSWDPEQVFGPRTPLVLARAAQIWEPGPEALLGILDRALVALDHVSIGYAGLVARAAAREPGRLPALERLERAVGSVLGADRPPQAHPGIVAVREWFMEGAPASDELERGWRNAHDILVRAVTTALVVEATADLLPDRMVTLGQGVVRTSLTETPVAPDQRWVCSASVAQALSTLFRSVPHEALLAASVRWAMQSEEGVQWPVLALLWTTPAFAPEVRLQVAPPGPALPTELQDRVLRGSVLLQEWANALAALLCHRAAVDPEVVDTFLECGRRVPGLAALLNEPLAAAG